MRRARRALAVSASGRATAADWTLNVASCFTGWASTVTVADEPSGVGVNPWRASRAFARTTGSFQGLRLEDCYRFPGGSPGQLKRACPVERSERDDIAAGGPAVSRREQPASGSSDRESGPSGRRTHQHQDALPSVVRTHQPVAALSRRSAHVPASR